MSIGGTLIGSAAASLQQSPAVGRAVSELIVRGRFTTLDLNELGYRRVLRHEPLPESVII